MKKMFGLTVAAAAIALAVSGCNSKSTDTNRFGEQIELNMTSVTLAPQITVGDKIVTGSSTSTVYWGMFKSGDIANQAHGVSFEPGKSYWGFSGDGHQRAAVYDACVKSGADILMAPQYTTTTSGNFFERTVTCSVKGFPGFIKGMKVVPEAKK